MKSPLRQIGKTLFALAVIFEMLLPALALAETACSNPPCGYQPLAPIAGTTDSSGKTNLSTYLIGVFKTAIAIAGALAVFMIVIGGIQYMSTDAIGGKEEGKERVGHAILGLILAIGSYLILNTLNPDLLNVNLTIKKLGARTGTDWAIRDEELDKAIQIATNDTIANSSSQLKNWDEEAAQKTNLAQSAALKEASAKTASARSEVQTAYDLIEGNSIGDPNKTSAENIMASKTLIAEYYSAAITKAKAAGEDGKVKALAEETLAANDFIVSLEKVKKLENSSVLRAVGKGSGYVTYQEIVSDLESIKTVSATNAEDDAFALEQSGYSESAKIIRNNQTKLEAEIAKVKRNNCKILPNQTGCK